MVEFTHSRLVFALPPEEGHTAHRIADLNLLALPSVIGQHRQDRLEALTYSAPAGDAANQQQDGAGRGDAT
jgi:hypothetical protein